MLLAEIMEYYTTTIDRSDHEMSISRLLMLSAAGLGLVTPPSLPDLVGEILIVPSFTISYSNILIKRQRW